MKIFRVGFCGAGGIVTYNHLPELEKRRDKFKVIGLFDVLREKAAKLAGNKYKTYSSYEDMLADGEIDLVVIATKPLSTHFPAAKSALEAGKHVVLEKPMASTTAECDELVNLAKKKKLLLTVHHNRRLDLDFLGLQDIIRKGKIGEPRLIVNNVSAGGYGSGDIHDWGIHLVDQCLLLNKNPLLEVSAMLCSPEKGLDDCGFGEAILRFAKPPVINFSMLPRPTEFLLNGTSAAVRYYAAGTKGSFIQRVIEDPRDLMNATQNFDGGRPDYAVPDYLEIKRHAYYDYLYDSLAENKPLLVKPEEARNAIRVFELILESARKNMAVKASNILKIN